MFLIKKTLTDKNGKKTYVLLTNGQSEVLEITDRKEADNLVTIMNENTDSGCHYEVIDVKNPKG